MNKRTVDQIIDAYDDACEIMGLTLPQMMKELCDATEKNLDIWRRARTRLGLMAILQKEPEPTQERLTSMLTAIELWPYSLRKALKEAAEKLPPDPGGRPEIITPQEAREICAYVGSLIGKGVKVPVALQRAADRWRKPEMTKSPLHTVRRAWYERANPKSRFYLGEATEEQSDAPAVPTHGQSQKSKL